MRLLLVEDEPDAARILAKGLRENAYAVDVVHDGEAACYQAAMADYDSIILDVMLPLKDGLAVCRQIRSEGQAVPILMLTARCGVDDRVRGLDSGADDYLQKPFDFRELLARVRALIRRGARVPLPDRLEVAGLDLDTASYRILALIGEGGMGTVYQAEQLHPQRFVALKMIRPWNLQRKGPASLQAGIRSSGTFAASRHRADL